MSKTKLPTADTASASPQWLDQLALSHKPSEIKFLYYLCMALDSCIGNLPTILKEDADIALTTSYTLELYGFARDSEFKVATNLFNSFPNSKISIENRHFNVRLRVSENQPLSEFIKEFKSRLQPVIDKLGQSSKIRDSKKLPSFCVSQTFNNTKVEQFVTVTADNTPCIPIKAEITAVASAAEPDSSTEHESAPKRSRVDSNSFEVKPQAAWPLPHIPSASPYGVNPGFTVAPPRASYPHYVMHPTAPSMLPVIAPRAFPAPYAHTLSPFPHYASPSFLAGAVPQMVPEYTMLPPLPLMSPPLVYFYPPSFPPRYAPPVVPGVPPSVFPSPLPFMGPMAPAYIPPYHPPSSTITASYAVAPYPPMDRQADGR